jgi:hypothetical protein
MTAPDCLGYALNIERRRPLREWKRAIEEVPAECRAEVEQYLRGMAERIRVIRGLRHAPSNSGPLDGR